ncbi:MAG: hypothetical protein C5B51_24205 [Terriglobia bacterium]|nr:MAG: hypothetical protein C5B51_24205 [Terriglobia bacterium]
MYCCAIRPFVLLLGLFVPAFAQTTYLQRYLAASTGVYLWVSDNNLVNDNLYRITAPGQSTLLATVPGGNVQGMAEVNGIVVTQMLCDSCPGLLRTDGSVGGTYFLPALTGLGILGSPLSGTALNGFVYFLGSDGTQYGGLFRTDGTVVNEVASLTPASILAVYGLQALGGKLYLRVLNTGALLEIFSSTGDAGSSFNLVTTLPNNNLVWYGPPTWIELLGSNLVFDVVGPGTGVTIFTAPAAGGAASILSQTNQGYSDLAALIGSKIFMRLYNNANGGELWVSDGTAGGTGMVKDLAPGPGSSTPTDFVEFNNLCYFLADNSPLAFPSGFFSSDGTNSGTKAVYNPRGQGSTIGLRQVNGRLFFFAPASARGGYQLAVSDGTPGGTKPVNIGAFVSQGLNDVWIQVSGGLYYFNYATSTANNIYRTDGTPAGTVLLGQF